MVPTKIYIPGLAQPLHDSRPTSTYWTLLNTKSPKLGPHYILVVSHYPMYMTRKIHTPLTYHTPVHEHTRWYFVWAVVILSSLYHRRFVEYHTPYGGCLWKQHQTPRISHRLSLWIQFTHNTCHFSYCALLCPNHRRGVINTTCYGKDWSLVPK